SAAVRKTRSPHTQGEERPDGTSVLHSRFVFGPNSTGGLSASATPEEFGPRNWGQDGTAAPAIETASRVVKAKMVFIAQLLLAYTSQCGSAHRCRAGKSQFLPLHTVSF